MKNVDLKDIVSLARSLRKKEFKTISMKARHDWKVMVVLFLFFALIVIVGHFLFFRWIESGRSYIPTDVETKDPATISGEMLEDTVIYFGERETRLTELQMKRGTPSDPSL